MLRILASVYLAARLQLSCCARGSVGTDAKTFSSGGRQNITLVGADGAGKSTVVSAFAEMLIDGHRGVPGSLMYQQVFMLDASSLISVASGRGELGNLVTRF